MHERKSLERLLRDHFERAGFFIPLMPREIDERAIQTALEAAKEYIIHEPTRAMYMFEDGLTQHLLSKRNLLDNLQTSKSKEMQK